MSEAQKRIIYVLGNENEFGSFLNERFKNCSNESYIYEVIHGDWTKLYHLLNKELIHLLICDFSEIKNNYEVTSTARKIIRLKFVEHLSKLPIVGLFDNKDIINLNSYIYSSGINYFHILGDDQNLFFGNIFYIAFDNVSCSLKLAHATKLQISEKLGHAAYISFLSGNTIKVESDITISPDSNILFQAFRADKCIQFDVLDQHPEALLMPMLNSYDLEFIISNSWDLENQENEEEIFSPVLQEDIESWQEILLKDSLVINEKFIVGHFYSRKIDWIETIVTSLPIEEFGCRVFSDFSVHSYQTKVVPDIIIFEVIHKTDLDYFDKMMTYYSEIETRSYILVKNHSSSSSELQVIYGYQNLLTLKEDLNTNDFSVMLKLFRKNKESRYSGDLFRFGVHNNFVDVLVDVTITSITENEITFKTKQEIPFFTLLNLKNESFDFFITVIPSYFNMSVNVGGYHYQGLINSVTEANRQKIRGVVKLFMNNIPDTWDGVKFSDVKTKKMLVEDESKIQNETNSVFESLPPVEENSLEKRTVKRTRVGTARSKL